MNFFRHKGGVFGVVCLAFMLLCCNGWSAGRFTSFQSGVRSTIVPLKTIVSRRRPDKTEYQAKTYCSQRESPQTPLDTGIPHDRLARVLRPLTNIDNNSDSLDRQNNLKGDFDISSTSETSAQVKQAQTVWSTPSGLSSGLDATAAHGKSSMYSHKFLLKVQSATNSAKDVITGVAQKLFGSVSCTCFSDQNNHSKPDDKRVINDEEVINPDKSFRAAKQLRRVVPCTCSSSQNGIGVILGPHNFCKHSHHNGHPQSVSFAHKSEHPRNHSESKARASINDIPQSKNDAKPDKGKEGHVSPGGNFSPRTPEKIIDTSPGQDISMDQTPIKRNGEIPSEEKLGRLRNLSRKLFKDDDASKRNNGESDPDNTAEDVSFWINDTSKESRPLSSPSSSPSGEKELNHKQHNQTGHEQIDTVKSPISNARRQRDSEDSGFVGSPPLRPYNLQDTISQTPVFGAPPPEPPPSFILALIDDDTSAHPPTRREANDGPKKCTPPRQEALNTHKPRIDLANTKNVSADLQLINNSLPLFLKYTPPTSEHSSLCAPLKRRRGIILSNRKKPWPELMVTPKYHLLWVIHPTHAHCHRTMALFRQIWTTYPALLSLRGEPNQMSVRSFLVEEKHGNIFPKTLSVIQNTNGAPSMHRTHLIFNSQSSGPTTAVQKILNAKTPFKRSFVVNKPTSVNNLSSKNPRAASSTQRPALWKRLCRHETGYPRF